MRNERLPEGREISVPVASGLASGSPVLALGAIPAVTSTKEGEGGNTALRASVKTGGVHALATTDAVAAEGTAIYITGAGALTITATGNTLYGWTLHIDGTGGTKSAGAGTVNIRLARV